MHIVVVTDQERIAELERSHAELRGALIFTGRPLQRLTRYRMDREPSLPILRNVLRDARAVSKKRASASSATRLHTVQLACVVQISLTAASARPCSVKPCCCVLEERGCVAWMERYVPHPPSGLLLNVLATFCFAVKTKMRLAGGCTLRNTVGRVEDWTSSAGLAQVFSGFKPPCLHSADSALGNSRGANPSRGNYPDTFR